MTVTRREPVTPLRLAPRSTSPGPTKLTAPVAVTVATLALLLLQVTCVVTTAVVPLEYVAVATSVPFWPTVAGLPTPVTVIAVIVGAGAATATFLDPVTFWNVARKSTLPAARNATTPAGDTVATAVLLLSHVT